MNELFEIVNLSLSDMVSKVSRANTLYRLCDINDLGLLCASDAYRLAERLRLVGGYYGLNLQGRFMLRIRNNKVEKQIPREKIPTDDFYLALARLLIKNNKFLLLNNSLYMMDRYRFDCSNKDMYLLKESVDAVVTLHEILLTELLHLDELIGTPNLESCAYKSQIIFSSRLLHAHVPSCIFAYDYKVRQGNMLAFSDTVCEFALRSDGKITASTISQETKWMLRLIHGEVVSKLRPEQFIENKRENIDKIWYLGSVIRQYVICCYLMRNKDKLDAVALDKMQDYVTLVPDYLSLHIRKTEKHERSEAFKLYEYIESSKKN